jgi:ATP10 protein
VLNAHCFQMPAAAECRYAFLLDRKGRVRFRGCGKAEAGERDMLIAAAHQLREAG